MINLVADLKRKKRLQSLARYIKSLRQDRLVIKDPLAIFSSEWLESTFNTDVVILIRHPAAVVSSYNKLNWSHDFTHFILQDALMREHLYPFKDDIERLVDQRESDIDRISTLWKIIYAVVVKLTIKHENWICVRYEDIAQNPVPGFESLFKKLNVAFSSNVEKFIEKSSFASSAVEYENPYSITRDSKEVSQDWKKRLSYAQVKRIRQNVEGVSEVFYPGESWRCDA